MAGCGYVILKIQENQIIFLDSIELWVPNLKEKKICFDFVF